MRYLLLLTGLLSGIALAQTQPALPGQAGAEIFRCPQADGTTSFQGTPCEGVAEPDNATPNETEKGDAADSTSDRDAFDFVNPFDAPAEASSDEVSPTSKAPLSADRAECEKQARDAIDAIDLEMRSGYTKAEGDAYLAELLELTRALRACKTL